MPGVAFDLEGNRLGYGKGILDMLLLDTKAFKIGLAYDFQMQKALPVEKHDVKVNMVITEERIYEF